MAAELTPEQRANLQAALAAGVAAIGFIIEPDNWPRFAAWAAARSNETWGPDDRLAFGRDITVLALMGGLFYDYDNAGQHGYP